MFKNNRIGYSLKIYDPAMVKYIKGTNRWSAIFSIILAVVVITGFYIYGERSAEMENPEAIYIGVAIAAMFILIALYQIISRYKSTTWDGTVIDKKIKKLRKSVKGQDYYKDYLEYRVTIQADNGTNHTITVEDDDTLYNYYQVGNRVRHHKSLNTYEKYDKSGDTIIFCNACASLNDINDDYCFRCKCPLLK
jgi:hypothetical protein